MKEEVKKRVNYLSCNKGKGGLKNIHCINICFFIIKSLFEKHRSEVTILFYLTMHACCCNKKRNLILIQNNICNCKY